MIGGVTPRMLPPLSGVPPWGGGALPYITYTGMCRGRGFEAPDLERGIHFRGVF